MQPPAKGRPPIRTGRGRTPTRWTGWEIALITLSVLMIAFPLYAEATRWVMPPLAPAQESTPSADAVAGETAAPEPPTAEPPTAEPPTAEPTTAEPPTAEPPTAE
ncbi:hypothetical protein K2Z83_07055, partial [Oscillochloris sp. ZM17-4]|nr:hypothetical protein [Oscillochloris sp. ZM17-4]